MKRWLLLLLFFPVVAFGQFRMVSSTVTLDSTVNDSTYIIDVDFFSDQTAKGYFASGITADYRVFSQTGQLYDITAASNLTLSSGELTIVEIDNNYVNTESAPVGQILVFDPQGDYITFTPFGNSNMGQVLQQAIGTYNAVVSAEGGSVPEWSGTANYEQFKQVSQDGKIYTNRTGTNTTTPPSSDLVNWELTNKNAILEEIEGRDTISQASHPFSVGDPLWYSGDYILAQDTSASVRVDGIVVEVIDANTFVRQRSGKFTLTAHGFTENIQLYVQDDGTYAATAGDNAIPYGYPVNTNEITIGTKEDQIRNIANKYNDLFAGRNASTTIEFLDSIAGFQSFADISSIQLSTPRIGYIIENRETGVRYIIQADSAAYYTIDDSLVIDLGDRFAVADLSNKRVFQNKTEAEREFSLLNLKNESITINGLRYKVSYSPPDNGVDSDNTLIVDGVFLDTINVNYSGQNLVLWSERIEEFGATTPYNITDGELLQNYAIGPDGKKTAEAVRFTGTSFQNLAVRLDSVKANTDYSIWFKVKAVNDVSAANLRARWSGESYVAFPTAWDDVNKNTWTDVRFTLPGVASPSQEININWTGGNIPVDSIFLIAQMDVSEGSQNLTYEKTESRVAANKQRLYLELDCVQNGVFQLWKLYDGNLSKSSSDDEIIQQAINYCDEGNRCNFVDLGKRSYRLITGGIQGSDNVQIIGSGSHSKRNFLNTDASQGAVINVATSTAVNVFEFDSGSTMYNTGMSNVIFKLESGARVGSYIYSKEVNNSKFFNLSGTAEEKDSVDIAFNFDALTSSSNNYQNDFSDIRVFNAKKGVRYGGSTSNNLFEIDVLQSDTGVYIQRGNFEAREWLIQGCSTAVYQNNGESLIFGLYTEGSGIGQPAIVMNGGSMSIFGGILQSKTSTDTLISSSGSDYLSIENTRITSNYPIYINGVESVLFKSNNTFQRLQSHVFLGSDFSDQLDRVTFEKNALYQNTSNNEVRKNEIPRLRINKGELKGSHFRNNYYSDTTFVSNVKIKGKRVNLSHNSNPWINDTIITSSDTIFVKDNVLDPLGTNNAATVVIDGDSWTGTTVLVVDSNDNYISDGDKFTIGFWLKRYTNKQVPLQFDVSDSSPYYYTNSTSSLGEWERVSFTDQMSSPTGTTFRLRLRSYATMAVNDSFSISGLSIYPGELDLGYIETTGTAIQDDSLFVSYEVPATFFGEIIYSDFGSSNKTAGQISKSYSGYSVGFASDGSIIDIPINWGVKTGTTDASGDISVAHGLLSGGIAIAPDNIKITNLDTSGARFFTVHSIGTSNFTVKCYDSSGTELNAGSVDFQWEAKSKAE